uniref:Odorant-binding protein 22 n=1 Tax=Chouioia cunea TaxID=1570515 RepID=A0A6B9CIH3_9HYME|nr:odorant-binding protein 22 [Chouioia cunea]
MKLPVCLIFSVFCFSSAHALLTKEAIESLRTHQKYCVRTSGVSEDHVEMARLDRQIHEDEYQEKFAVCMLNKFNIMNTDGSINKDEISYVLLTDNPWSYQTAKDCTALVGSNVRETARKITNCLLQTDIIVIAP